MTISTNNEQPDCDDPSRERSENYRTQRRAAADEYRLGSLLPAEQDGGVLRWSKHQQQTAAALLGPHQTKASDLSHLEESHSRNRVAIDPPVLPGLSSSAFFLGFLPRLSSSAFFLGFLPRPSRPERKGLIPPLDLTGDSQTTDAHAAARPRAQILFFLNGEWGRSCHWQLSLSLSTFST